MRDMEEEEDTRLERSFSALESKMEILFLLKILSQTCFGFLSKQKKCYLDNIGDVGHDIAEHEGFITESRKYKRDILVANETIILLFEVLWLSSLPHMPSVISFALYEKSRRDQFICVAAFILYAKQLKMLHWSIERHSVKDVKS